MKNKDLHHNRTMSTEADLSADVTDAPAAGGNNAAEESDAPAAEGGRDNMSPAGSDIPSSGDGDAEVSAEDDTPGASAEDDAPGAEDDDGSFDAGYEDDAPDVGNDDPFSGEDAWEDDFDYEYDGEDFDPALSGDLPDGDSDFDDVPEEDEDVAASRVAADAARQRSSRSRKKRARMVLAQRIGIAALIVAAAALVAAYILGCMYFSSHFMFRTTLNGTDVSLMSEEDVEDVLLAAAEDYVLTIEGRGGVTDSIDGAAIDLEPVFDGTIGELIGAQNTLTWPATLFLQTALTSDATASFDEASLSKLIVGLAFYDEANVVEPIDATYILGEDGLEIVPEEDGAQPETAGLTAAIVSALEGFTSTLTLDDSCYVAPSVLSDNEELLATVAALNAWMETEITLVFDEDAEGTLSGAGILALLTTEDGTLVADTSEENDSAQAAVLLTSATVTGYVEAVTTAEEAEASDDDADTQEDSEDTDDVDEDGAEASDEEDDTDGDGAKTLDEEDNVDGNAQEEEDEESAEEAGDGEDEETTAADAVSGEDSVVTTVDAQITAPLDLSGVMGTSFACSEELVTAYVNALADQYDTYGNDLVFHTTSGETVTVPGGNYGWLMDRETTAAALYELLSSSEGGELEIVWTQTAEQFGSDDIGDTYAEVDLDEQKVYLYVDGELVLSTDCVSGKATDSSRYTPDGVFRITYRKSPATLTGTDYVSYVTYWMPFNYGIGFHDATWRSSFGGSIYITNGSHGCINLPYSAAETLYSYVYSGMPVIVFGGVLPSETTTTTTTTETTSTEVEEEGSEAEQEAAEAAIIEQAIANYVAIGMTEEAATAQVEADLAAQLAEQQAAAEAEAAAAAQAAEQAAAATEEATAAAEETAAATEEAAASE